MNWSPSTMEDPRLGSMCRLAPVVENLLGTALACCANAVFLTDQGGRIEWVNRAFVDLCGYTPQELIGSTPDLLRSGLQDDHFYQGLWHTLRAGEVWRGELVERHKEGKLYSVHQTVTPIPDASGPKPETHFLFVNEDITARKDAERRLEYLACYDELTGLPNRYLLLTRLRDTLASSRRSGQRFAVHFLDLDRFKSVNDMFGHSLGDELLRAVAGRLRGCVRTSDLVARLAGDEFVVVQADLHEARGAATLARKIVDVLNEPFSIFGKEIHTGTSVGIALSPDISRVEDPEELLHHADLAMYQAKKHGRGTYVFFNSAIQTELVQREEQTRQLARALEGGELLLHYQPRLLVGPRSGGAPTGRRPEGSGLAGIEAVLRWRHPSRGLEPSAWFFPLAEQSSLLGPLSRWALRRACATLRGWLTSGLATGPMTVKVPAVLLEQDNFVAEVRCALEENALPAGMLELEVKEGVLLRQAPVRGTPVGETLRRLAELGVGLALDDFGDGVIPLRQLRSLPIGSLKLSPTVTAGLGTEPTEQALVRALVDLSHSLQRRVVAKGVESAAQFHALAALGCDEVQGFHFAPPLPSEDLQRWLTGRATTGTLGTAVQQRS